MSMNETHTKTSEGVIEDVVRESPVDRYLERRRRRVLWLLVLIVIAVALAWLLRRFTRDCPVDYRSDVDHFKYGSIGAEPGGSPLETIGGLVPPYPIFLALPRICPDQLPGGYASLGFIFEKGHDLPIGVSRRFRLGFDQVGLNCAVCHTGTVRESSYGARHVIPGMPSHQLDLQNFIRFLFSCMLDPRFTPDNVLGAIERQGIHLSAFDRLAYRVAVIPQARATTLALQQKIARLMGTEVTEWGRGRVDTFNPYKGLQFNWQLERLPRAELQGASDYPALWNQKPRDGMWLHWDGNNDSVDERNLSAALGAGVTPATVDHARLARVRNWIWTLPPPPYPFAVDRALADRGQALYDQHCRDCHADHQFRSGIVTGSRVGKVVEDLAEIGTDPSRLNSYTEEFAANQYTLYPNSQYSFRHFRKTGGYANQPLDGIWARAPYLHNGSVPTLRDLLEPPAARPRVFYRGYDVYDPKNLGFVSSVAAENGTAFSRYDTALPGNHNSGHLYGTKLSPAEKDAIVEYMKTF